MDRAVSQHREHRSSEYSGLLGNLVVADVKVADLIDVLDQQDSGNEIESALPITLLVTGGAGAIGPAVRWASRSPLLDLRVIEVALRDEEDLAHNARRFLTALDACEDDLTDVATFVELPRWQGAPTPGWLRALDEVAAADLGAKFRTGGADPENVPTADELATCFDASLDRELPFRCAGGPTPPITQIDPASGVTRYGYANLLIATRSCLDGGDVVGVLQETSIDGLFANTDSELLTRTRRWFRGITTHSLIEAHDEAVELGLLPTP